MLASIGEWNNLLEDPVDNVNLISGAGVWIRTEESFEKVDHMVGPDKAKALTGMIILAATATHFG